MYACCRSEPKVLVELLLLLFDQKWYWGRHLAYHADGSLSGPRVEFPVWAPDSSFPRVETVVMAGLTGLLPPMWKASIEILTPNFPSFSCCGYGSQWRRVLSHFISLSLSLSVLLLLK